MLTNAQRKVVTENIPLVHQAAKRYIKSLSKLQLDYSDIVKQGCLGLIRSVQRFDPKLGYRFSSYAVPQIHYSIRLSFRLARKLRIPRRALELRVTINKRRLEDSNTQEIADKLSVSKKLVEEAFEVTNVKVSSLNDVAFHDEMQSIHLIDMVPAHDDTTSMFVTEFLSMLTPFEKTVVLRRMDNAFQSEIGEEMSCTQAHISRTLKKVQAKMLAYMRGEALTV